MILHIVLFDFKKGVSWQNQRAIEAETVSKGHSKHIPQIKKWTVGRNVISRSQSSDFCVMGLFEDKEDLEIYQAHEDHMCGVDSWKEISDWKVMDIAIQGDEIDDFDLMFSKSKMLREKSSC